MNQYDNIPAVRRSDLWELRKSPAHYLYKVTHPEEGVFTDFDDLTDPSVEGF